MILMKNKCISFLVVVVVIGLAVWFSQRERPIDNLTDLSSKEKDVAVTEFVGCTHGESGGGVIKVKCPENIFTNEHFGFTVSLPEGYVILVYESKIEIPNDKKYVDSQQTYFLIAASEFAFDNNGLIEIHENFTLKDIDIIEELISQRNRTNSRGEERRDIEVNGLPAISVRVPKSAIPEWTYVTIYIPAGDRVYVLGMNEKDPAFEYIYESFTLL